MRHEAIFCDHCGVPKKHQRVRELSVDCAAEYGNDPWPQARNGAGRKDGGELMEGAFHFLYRTDSLPVEEVCKRLEVATPAEPTFADYIRQAARNLNGCSEELERRAERGSRIGDSEREAI